MTFIEDLESHIRDTRPDLATARAADGETLRITQRGEGESEEPEDALEVQVHETEGGILLDWVWRLPVSEGSASTVRDFVLSYVSESIENSAWEVPIVLKGGPLNGHTLTKTRRDLVGRLLFARTVEPEDATHKADIYKWRLKRNAAGEYVCVFERTIEGEELDRFIARGVESTGPFVVIHPGP
jgi:hypothetical protein